MTSPAFRLRYSILAIFVLLISAASLLCGAERASFVAAFNGDMLARVILFNLRLPRVLLTLVAGAMLGGAGAISQMYFRNPIAEPGIMGLTAGATLGAVIAAALIPCAASCLSSPALSIPALSIPAINIGAFIGALCTGAVLLSLLGVRTASPAAILLCGAALGTFASAITSVLLLAREDALRAMYVWALGSMSGKGWAELRFVAFPAVIALFSLRRASRTLDLITGGEAAAAALGVEVKRLAALVLIALSLAVSVAVCAGGTIGFVGLVSPHIARRFFPPKALPLLAASALCGSALLAASDVIARTAFAPAELPVGVVTSLIGAPFFVYLMIKAAQRRTL